MYQFKLKEKQVVFILTIVTGAIVGLCAIILKYFAHFLTHFFKNHFGQNDIVLFILPLVGILISLLIIIFIYQSKLTKGLSQIHFAIRKQSSNLPKSQITGQILTSSFTVGAGGSVGLEAPIVITGAAIGSNLSKLYKLGYKERTLLLACGVAAGISATFNAPIAGVLFTLEVLLLDINISAFVPLIISSAIGALISNICNQNINIFEFKGLTPFNYMNIPFYLVLGIVSGLLAFYYARIIQFIEILSEKFKLNLITKFIFGGVLLCGILYCFPNLRGEGFDFINALVDINKNKSNSSKLDFEFATIILIIFIKPFATSLTNLSGGNGGNFAPSLFVGACTGYVISNTFNSVFNYQLPLSNFTVVGMAGLLSGIYHAPLTAIFLIAEITGGYLMMIPLMIVSSVAFLVSRTLDNVPLDSKSLISKGINLTQHKDLNIIAQLNLNQLIETDFQVIYPKTNLGEIVNLIANSHRNLYPVVEENGKLVGIIRLDDIRNIIFEQNLYKSIIAYDLYQEAEPVIYTSDTMDEVMAKFDYSACWNIPVINEKDLYIGFISKSSLLTLYRDKIKI